MDHNSPFEYRMNIIHTLPFNFLLSDWFFINTRRALKMYNARRVPRPGLRGMLLMRTHACDLHMDWSIILTGKVVFVFHTWLCYNTSLFIIFTHYDQTIIILRRVWIRSINLHLLCSRNATTSIHLHWFLMLVHCTRPCGPRAMDASKPSARALISSHFSHKVNAHLLTYN